VRCSSAPSLGRCDPEAVWSLAAHGGADGIDLTETLSGIDPRFAAIPRGPGGSCGSERRC